MKRYVENAPLVAATTSKAMPNNELNEINTQQQQYSADILRDELPCSVAEAAHWWFEFGFTVIPIDPQQKKPFVKWQSWIDNLSHASITEHWKRYPEHDLGAVLDDKWIVPDADNEQSLLYLQALENSFELEPNLIVKTKRGEHHFFKRKVGTYAKTRGYSSDKFPNNIDIKTGRSINEGRSIVVLAPSTNKSIVINEAETANDLVEVAQDFIDAIFEHNGEEPPRPITPVVQQVNAKQANQHKAKEILSYIDPDLNYEDWNRCLTSLHDEFNGSDIGLKIADTWSASGKNYAGFEVIEYKWRSYKVGGGVGFGSVCHIAQQAGADLSEINSRYDDEGNPLPTYDELMTLAKAMDEDTPEDEIEQVVRGTQKFSAIQRRKVFDCVKRQTKLPLETLKLALKESRPDEEEPDQLTLAKKVVDNLGRDNVISASSFVWGWNDCGVWKKLEERTIRQFVHDTVPPLVDMVSKNLIEGVSDLFKTEVFKPEHEFDVGEPESVNCLNGELSLYDVAGGWVLEEHNKQNYRTTQIPIEYDASARAPRFMQFMNEVFKGDTDADDKITALLEMVGYSLMAHCRHERFIILVGSGANGKSVLLSVLEALCGSTNVAGVQPSQFDNKFQRAHLHGKLANIVTEIEQGQVIADAALKGIVSGEPTTVEYKHKDPFMMRPFSTCWFGTNHMPHTRDFSDALFRRALVVSFNNTFKPELGNCDPNLKDKLLDELPGILNLALAAYADAIQNGFTMPESCDAARKEWRLEADQVAQFVDECCITDSNFETPIGDAFEKYQIWSTDNGINRKLAKKGFRDRLTRLGYGERRTKKARLVTGLKVKSLFDKSFSYDQIRD